MAKAEKNSRKRRLLNDGPHQLLSIKELVDRILDQAHGVPVEVKTAIATARDVAWRNFVQQQENTMSDRG